MSPKYLSDRLLFMSDISGKDTRRGLAKLSAPLQRTASSL